MAVDSLDTNLLASGKKKKTGAPGSPELPQIPQNGRRALKVVAYVAIFLAALTFFFYLKTPASLVQSVVLNNLNQSGGALQWQADSITSHVFVIPHLRAENLSVSSMRGAFPTVNLQTVNIAPSILSLLPWVGGFNPSLSFDGDAYKAQFSGKFWPKTGSINLNLANLDFSQLVPLTDAGVQLKGIISELSSELYLQDGRLSLASGQVTAKGKGFVVDPAALHLPLPLPVLDLGTLDLQAEIDKGRVTIRKLQVGTPGKDLEMSATGTLQLSDNIQFSRLDLHLRLKPSMKILGAMPSLKTMLETISAPQPDGFYAMKLSGTFLQMGLPTPDR